MNTNHHLSKPVMIGKVGASGTFDVVWQSINPVRADAWSKYIPDSAKRRRIGPFLGYAGAAPSPRSKNSSMRHRRALRRSRKSSRAETDPKKAHWSLGRMNVVRSTTPDHKRDDHHDRLHGDQLQYPLNQVDYAVRRDQDQEGRTKSRHQHQEDLAPGEGEV